MAGLKIGELKKNEVMHESSSAFDFLNRDIRLVRFRLSDSVKEAFYHELGILLEAGVAIKSALELSESQQSNSKVREVIKSIREDVVSGHSLSSALIRTTHFTSYEYFSIQIGEESGKIVDVLRQLAQYYGRKIKQQRQLINALSYPGLIFFTSIAAVFFMLYFIVPMFADIFKRFGGELPYVTRMIITVSNGVADYFVYIVAIIFGVVLVIYLNRSKEWFKRFGFWLIKRTPLIGTVVIKIQLARFCTSMALLTGARVPLVRAIQLVGQMITFYPLKRSLSKVEQDVMSGKQFHSSLADFDIYDQRMIALIKVGEEVNQLDQFFQKLASSYSEEAEYKTTMLSTFLEPVMIIFLGLVVGLILVAMYLPMFQLSTTIGG